SRCIGSPQSACRSKPPPAVPVERRPSRVPSRGAHARVLRRRQPLERVHVALLEAEPSVISRPLIPNLVGRQARVTVPRPASNSLPGQLQHLRGLLQREPDLGHRPRLARLARLLCHETLLSSLRLLLLGVCSGSPARLPGHTPTSTLEQD